MKTPLSQTRAIAAAAALLVATDVHAEDLSTASFSPRDTENTPTFVSKGAPGDSAVQKSEMSLPPPDSSRDSDPMLNERRAALLMMGATSVVSFFGLFGRQRFRDEIQSRIINRPTGFDLQDREFLEGLMNSASTTLGAVNRSFDVLAYAWNRLEAKDALLIANKYRLYSAISASAGMFSGIGLSFMTGEWWSACAGTFAVLSAYSVAMIKVLQPLEERGDRVIEQFNEWRRNR